MSGNLRDLEDRNKTLAVPTLPPREPRDIGPDAKVEQISTGMPKWLWKKLAEIAETDGYSRNEVITIVMRQFADEWDEKRKSTRKSSK